MGQAKRVPELTAGRLSELARVQKRWRVGDSIPADISTAAGCSMGEFLGVIADWKVRSLTEARFLAFLVIAYPSLAWPARVGQRLILFLERDGVSEADAITEIALASMFRADPSLPHDLLRWHMQEPGSAGFSRNLLFLAMSVREADPALFLACVKCAALTPSVCSLSGILASGHVDAGPEFDARTSAFLGSAMEALSDPSWLHGADPAAVINLVGDLLKISGLGLLQEDRFGSVLDWALGCCRSFPNVSGTLAMLCAPLAYWASEVDDIAPWMEAQYRRAIAGVRTDPGLSTISAGILDAIETGVFRQLSPIGGGPIRANALSRIRSATDAR